MNIQLYGHSLEVTPAIRQYTEEKIGHISTILTDVDNVHVALTVNRHHQHGEIFTVDVQTSIGKHALHVSETASDLYAAVDQAEEALLHQARKVHSQTVGRNRRLQQMLSPRRYLSWGKRLFRR